MHRMSSSITKRLFHEIFNPLYDESDCKIVLDFGILTTSQCVIDTTESVITPRSQLLYRRVSYYTAESVTIPRSQLIYRGVSYYTAESVTIPRSQLLHRGVSYYTAESFWINVSFFVFIKVKN